MLASEIRLVVLTVQGESASKFESIRRSSNASTNKQHVSESNIETLGGLSSKLAAADGSLGIST